MTSSPSFPLFRLPLAGTPSAGPPTGLAITLDQAMSRTMGYMVRPRHTKAAVVRRIYQLGDCRCKRAGFKSLSTSVGDLVLSCIDQLDAKVVTDRAGLSWSLPVLVSVLAVPELVFVWLSRLYICIVRDPCCGNCSTEAKPAVRTYALLSLVVELNRVNRMRVIERLGSSHSLTCPMALCSSFVPVLRVIERLGSSHSIT
ncbi:hypothetical protein F511_19965 [Dorcoceras hygrometricum]|uniref:Uncharacterized protein n=1 Tax=Dorcoceras hygrometricum TaxID=472368 RepID=A0A2Z7A7T7_9LAMI|nr:hypothetical protein F511_19965 [Dorcoceras hygrometricum]